LLDCVVTGSKVRRTKMADLELNNGWYIVRLSVTGKLNVYLKIQHKKLYLELPFKIII